MNPSSLVYVAGHRGMAGSALCRALRARGFERVIGRTRAELDLMDGAAVERFLLEHRPEYVFFAAARVGGILANDTLPWDFLYENLQIQNNVIAGAWRAGVRRLLFLGSSCIYPRDAPQPIAEEALLSGPLEPTNEWYAVAKIAGIKLCQALRRQHGAEFFSVMPCNLYGPGDNYDPQSAHVLPALIRRFAEAKACGAPFVTCWGSGGALREFLHADDLARACLPLMEAPERPPDLINAGSGEEISIRELAELVREATGYAGEIRWDPSKPDGTPRKLLDSSRLFALGWRPRTALREGIAEACRDFARRFAA